jgi:hypothetical protein
MDSRANVKSISALDSFAKSLSVTEGEMLRCVEATQVELNRISDYLERSAPAYWKREYQRSQEKLEVARAALSRCEQVTREDERKSCFLEKKQVAVAKQRVDFCEDRLRALKAINQKWQQERLKTFAHIQQVLDIAETGLPAAQNTLKQIMAPLRAYASLEGSVQVNSTTDT